jgi:LDH2 family malate/lactate/ureidoglycolate dehydrogenase
MVEALSVGLTGAGEPGLDPREGALVICLAADAFHGREQVERSLDSLRARLRGSSQGDATVLAPGDPEARSRAAADGFVSTEGTLLAELVRLARQREEARP